MANLSRYAQMLERLKGIKNPEALNVLSKGEAEAANLAGQAMEANAHLPTMEANASEPLTHSPFEAALKNIEKKHLQDQETGFQLVGEPQDKGFTLGEAGEISRPPVPYKAPVEPEVINLPAIAENAKTPAGEVIDLSPSWMDTIGNNKGKILAGGAALGGGAMLYGKGSPSQAQMEQGNRKPAVLSQEEAPPVSEADKELNRQIAAIQGNINKPDAIPKTSVVDFGQGSTLANMQGLKDAQEQARIMGGMANLRDSTAGLAYDIAGVERPDKLVGGANMRKQAEGIVPAYQQRVQFEKEDPNSPQSKGYRDLAKAMGFEIKGNASAADLEKLYPQLSNIYTQREAVAARKDMMRDKLGQLRLQQANQKDAKSAADDEKQFTKYAQLLGNPTNRTPLGQATAQMFSIDRVQALLNGELNPNDINPNELSEIVKGLDRTISGGTGSLEGQKSLDPNTWKSHLARLMQQATSKSQGAGAGAFVTRINQNLEREKATARRKAQEVALKVLAGADKLAHRRPDDMRDFLNRSGLPVDLFDQRGSQRPAPSDTSFPGGKPPVKVSDHTTNLINSRSEEENRKRLEELKKKHGIGN